MQILGGFHFLGATFTRVNTVLDTTESTALAKPNLAERLVLCLLWCRSFVCPLTRRLKPEH